MALKKTGTVFASAARTTTTNSSDQTLDTADDPASVPGAIVLFLDVSVVSGTSPTLDIKVQMKDPISGNYVDMPSAAFAQKTAVGTDTLTIYPGALTIANRQVNAILPKTWRLVATIGGATPSFTFSVGLSS